jgi:hypothetical protein
MFPGSLLVRFEDGAQLNHKNAKKVAAKLEIGGLLEEAISKLVELSRQPARIEWKEEITRSSSQSGLLGVQSLVAIGARNENSQAFETL